MATPEGAAAGGFRLMRYFMLTTLVAFIGAWVALLVLQRNESIFFAQVQAEQRAFFARAQAILARQNEAAARDSLLAVHEASHVNLTRLVANTLWASDIAPLLAQAQKLPADDCRAVAGEARRACQAEIGARIRALPGFKALDTKAYAAMQSTTVFKIKVWDRRGITVYSSEQRQIGDDGSSNQGWRQAMAGQPASELTHRDRFSAFEGMVENRDVISTYVPVRLNGGAEVAGVVELYSDVTPFLGQMREASSRFAHITAANEITLERAASENQDKVDSSSDRLLFIVGGLLVALYGVSLLVVHVGQRIIDRQTLAQQDAARRERLWHGEKMAALAAMAANVAHEVGNPLAVIAGLAQELPGHAATPEAGATAARAILEQTRRVSALVRQISDFAASRGDAAEWVDVNTMVEAVCQFHRFDRRFRGARIAFVGAAGLPACRLVPDRLNELMMGLLQAFIEDAGARPHCPGLHVETLTEAGLVLVRCRSEAASEAPLRGPSGARAEALQRLAEGMGGRLSFAEGRVQLALPPEVDMEAARKEAEPAAA
ncbi:histidine kinase dimerization/phospho-acceptor domain-containing protein [Rubrivivax sp. A210]|uniref:histidine kinase dimerization/phospho-acceptor domain-containing protein n=1 Tax=Rubrivivax sp. A210 TaxID=2772301 RepID=UPI00191B57E3|nr:histidine kinase dimerization/phospho-acceptor domain-containing protein [Rubrivivax sp. A210]